MSIIEVNRKNELACYRQFPKVFKTLYGQPLVQALSIYNGLIDEDEVVLSKSDVKAIEDENTDLFKYVFGYEAGDF